MHDSKLTLDQLERGIRPTQLRDQQLEVLALSAYQTAARIDRAARGTAGVAVKADAPSTFASLCSVNDRALPLLVGKFDASLTGCPGVEGTATPSHARTLLP